MSKLYVNTIYPQSGNDVFVSGNLDVSGTLKAYRFQTNIEEKTVYLGTNNFGNSNDDRHHFTGSVYITGSTLELRAGEATAATISLIADQGDDVADTTTISVADGGTLTVDCALDITLDADGGEVYFKDAGVQQGVLKMDTSNKFILSSSVSTNDLYLMSGRDIVLDADGADIVFADGGATKATFTMGSSLEIDVPSGDLTLDVNGDIILDADGGEVFFKDAGVQQGVLKMDTSNKFILSSSIPVNDFYLMSGRNMVLDTGDLTCDAGGDINLDADGGEIYFKDAGVQQGVLKMDTANKFILSSSVSVNDVYVMSGRDIVLDASAADISLQDDATQYLKFTNSSGDCIVYNGAADKDIIFKELGSGNVIATIDGGEEAIIVADDKKIYFGDNKESSMEYDEDGTNRLIISGSAAGIDVTGSTYFKNDVIIVGNLYGGSPLEISGSVSLGTDCVDSIYLSGSLTASCDTVILDDKKIYFGTQKDAYLEYDEAGTDRLILSGAKGGLNISGSAIYIGTSRKMYFGDGDSAYIFYGNPGGGNEFAINLGAQGGGIQMPDNDGAAFEIREAGNTYMRFNTGDSYADVRCPKPFGVMDDVTLNFGTPSAAGVPGTMEYDANGTSQVVLSPPAAGFSIGSGLHRIAVDLSITGSHGGDNTVVNQLYGVKIPNDAFITRVVAITKTLSNLNAAIFNIQLSATSGTAEDTAISSGTEILGAGASGTIDSNGENAADIIMSNGGNSGIANRVWMNTSGSAGFVHKATADNFVYVCNAGTANGTSAPSVGTMTIIIEYYGID